jgi:cytochrome c oxidase cbb3-type subunit IV
MSLELLRNLGTVSAFIAFIAVCVWAYSSKRKADFDVAAQLPFADEPFADESFTNEPFTDEPGADERVAENTVHEERKQ